MTCSLLQGPGRRLLARSKASGIWRTPATCCTCRRACATTASRSIAASPTPSAFARRAARSSAPPFSTGSTSAACREADYRDAGLKPAARPGELPKEMVSFRRRAARPHPLVAQRRRTIRRRIPERAQAARGFQPGPRAACLRELDRAPRCQGAPALPRPPVFPQRRELRIERQARRGLARARRPSRRGRCRDLPGSGSPV